MTSCTIDVCGTGVWRGALPGDPDVNNSVLSAVPAFGGIDVSWIYPGLNPQAVAHTLLYRAISNDITGAFERVVSGNVFYDKVNANQQYFYWIKIVSVNGTVGNLIGPASATARPLIADLITELTGKIDSGLLANSLRGELNQLSVINANLANEIFDRENGETSFAAALLQVQNGVAGAHTFIANETASRVTADQAIAESVNLLAVTTGSNVAAVVTNTSAWITQVNGKVTDIGALWTTKLTVNNLVGGFGVYNNGQYVEAGFDVDTFWVGRTNANKRKPFIIVGNETFIDQAVINKLTFSKLTDEAGTFVVENGKVKADYLKVSTASIDDAAITNAKIGNLSVDTLKIQGNAVTVPASGSSSCSIYMPYAGTVYVTANLWVFEDGGGGGGLVTTAFSMFIQCTSGQGAGYCENHTAESRHSAVSTAGRFDVPAGVWTFSIVLTSLGGHYTLRNATIMAIGTMR